VSNSANDRREQILNVALTAFAKSGYHNTSMNDVADQMGVTKPVLYQYFDSKRALYIELLEHVGSDAVGSEHDRRLETRRSGIADGVVHVATRIVSHPPGKGLIESHAVDEEPVLVGQTAKTLTGLVIVGAFGNVNVNTDAEIAGQPGGIIQKTVRTRERGVHADHAPTTGSDEALVLDQTPTAALDAVTIGDPVRAHDPHAHFGASFGDHVEASLDRVRTLVMIDDPGGSRHQRLDGAERGRPTNRLQIECRVEPPPDLFEDAPEVGGLHRRRRHAPRQGGVQVVVATHHARSRRRHVSPRSHRVAWGAWFAIDRRGREARRRRRRRSVPDRSLPRL